MAVLSGLSGLGKELMVSNTLKPYTMITDFVTGKDLPNIGAEVKRQAIEKLESLDLLPFPRDRLEREKLIFRTYDSENVNVQRNI